MTSTTTSKLRRLLVWVGVSAAASIAAVAGLAAWYYIDARHSNVGQLDFTNRLAIPPLVEPSVDAGGRKVFELTLQDGISELLPGKHTPTWGANGTYLGPTLRAERGDDVVVNVHNRLPEATTVHWHGMHLPAAADGGPHQMIEPGATWSPSWTVDQPAATLWYHPHPHGDTADHVYRGVAGLFLLDDPQAEALALPTDYGVDDIPVIVQDKRFNDDGTLSFAEPTFSPIGLLGSEILVNGTHNPHLEVTRDRLRLRLLNASNARIYNFGFSDQRSFDLIGTDGGLLQAAHRTNRIQLSPGERAEILVDLGPGDTTVLRSYPPSLGAGLWQDRFAGGDDSFDVLQLRASEHLDAAAAATPEPLATQAHIDPDHAVATRHFELNGSSRINGQRMDMSRIDAVATVDTTEIWEIENRSGNPHNFHVHDVQFRILDVDGEPPPPALAGRKDTVYIPPDTAVRLLLEFSDHTNDQLPYMFHCHILRHEDRGMMGQYVVVGPDDPPTGASGDQPTSTITKEGEPTHDDDTARAPERDHAEEAG